MKEKIEQLKQELKNKTTREIVRYILDTYKDRAVLASGLGAEDQVLTDIAVKNSPGARIFVIDTKMLNPETYELLRETELWYSINFEVYTPDIAAVIEMVETQGKELFYESMELRKKCCHIRKIEPLKRVLSTADVWITGLRKDQSVTRSDIDIAEWDEANGLIKINPLADWTEEPVWDYIKENGVPYNRLHNENYPSIGCAPCTRAIHPGEDTRAGRWWWEQPEHKECGLHRRPVYVEKEKKHEPA
ncbi:MAG: phosphoadenylyl-sulfate reductase [bacterium]|nr:phosphoadenylyl-sulfate reductase [bacterium]